MTVNLEKWAEETGISSIGKANSSSLDWAIETLSERPHEIHALDPDSICELGLAINAWHLHLRKQLSRARSALTINPQNIEAKIKVDTLLEICKAIPPYLEWIRLAYNDRYWEKRDNAKRPQ